MDKTNHIKQYKTLGYVQIKNFFEIDNINKVRELIQNNGFDNKKSEIYYEEINGEKKIRRVENLAKNYKEFKNLIYNKLLQEYLFDIFGEKSFLFKEKLNFKPSKGGGKFRMHIDGHFDWFDSNNNKKQGWREYGNQFVNVVVPIESSTIQNGCLYVCEISQTIDYFGNNWQQIRSRLDGSGPHLKTDDEKKFKKIYIEQEPTDLLLFDWRCVHGSEQNMSDYERPILYLTYNSYSDGDNLDNYYYDKKFSKNTSKNKSLY